MTWAQVPSHTFGINDPRLTSHWTGAGSSQVQLAVAQWRFRSASGLSWGGVYYAANLFAVVLYCIFEYETTIIEVEDEFEVKTDTDSIISWFRTVFLILAVIFIVEFVVEFILCRDKSSFFVMIRGYIPVPTLHFLDAMSIIGMIMYFVDDSEDSADVRYDIASLSSWRMLLVCQSSRFLFHILALLQTSTSPRLMMFYKAVLDISMQALALVFVGAALFMHIENWSEDRDPKLEFFQCIYFVVVTMTTVGYGDISPSSNLSMAFTIILMLYLIMGLFPMFTELVELLAHMNKYNSMPATFTDQPVIICSPRPINLKTIRSICLELFHPSQPQKVSVCIVSPCPPDEEMEFFLWENSLSLNETVYIQGSIDDDVTLARAGVPFAKACIVLADQNAAVSEMDNQDQEACMLALRLRQFTHVTCKQKGLSRHPMRIILQLHQMVNSVYFKSSFYGATPDDQHTYIVGLRSWQTQSIANSTIVPAFSTFLANLNARAIPIGRTSAPNQIQDAGSATKWLDEYMLGSDMDIYPIQLPEHLKVVDQAALSAFVYAQTGCCLMNKSVLAPDAGALGRVVTLLQTLTAAQVQESNANKEVEMEVHKWFSSKPKPLTPELCKKLQWAYQRVGFQQTYGDIDGFARLHYMTDPSDIPSLMQNPYSEHLMGLKNHTIVVAPHLKHIAHFVRVMRASTAPHQDICIVGTGEVSDELNLILSAFSHDYARLFVVQTDRQGVELAEAVLIGCGLEQAKHVVLMNSSSADSYSDLQVGFLRLQIRNLNPNAKVITEIHHWEDAQHLMRGDNEINAWSQGNQSHYEHARICNEWMSSSDAENKARVCASGKYVERTGMIPLLTACVFKGEALHELRTMIGGCKGDVFLVARHVPEQVVGKTYGYLYKQLACQGLVPIALFRVCADDEKREVITQRTYLYTNPLEHTVLRASDLAYIVLLDQAQRVELGDTPSLASTERSKGEESPSPPDMGTNVALRPLPIVNSNNALLDNPIVSSGPMSGSPSGELPPLRG